MAAVCSLAEPWSEEWDGVLFETAQAELPAASRAALTERPWMRASILRAARQVIGISGGPLSSSAATPFALDGREFASVWVFYQTLKLAEDDPRRAELAAGRWGRGRVKRARRGVFRYLGEEVSVNSVQHGVLVARATEAKVQAHAEVRQALAATGTTRLAAGDPMAGAIGRWMPFALMVLRLRLRR
jgi:predicted NAD-dependent protein-ADP-ribosyltransferase YbiA (DUF1768 family)